MCIGNLEPKYFARLAFKTSACCITCSSPMHTTLCYANGTGLVTPRISTQYSFILRVLPLLHLIARAAISYSVMHEVLHAAIYHLDAWSASGSKHITANLTALGVVWFQDDDKEMFSVVLQRKFTKHMWTGMLCVVSNWTKKLIIVHTEPQKNVTFYFWL